MDISIFESLLYAFMSAITEFMPVSSTAHEQILLRLFGLNSVHPMMQLFVHIGILVSLFFACRVYLRHMSREERLRKIPKRRRKRQPDPRIVMDASFLKTACIPLLLGFAFYSSISGWENRLPLSAALLVLNGLILHIPIYFIGGNRDSQSLTRLDAIAFGAVSALGMIPGLSRIGIAASYGALRAADHSHVYKWCLNLSLPAVAVMTVFDVIFMIAAGFAGISFIYIIQCILAAAMAFLGATISIRFVRFIVERAGLNGFSYYCWGAALFAFILYLYT